VRLQERDGSATSRQLASGCQTGVAAADDRHIGARGQRLHWIGGWECDAAQPNWRFFYLHTYITWVIANDLGRDQKVAFACGSGEI
jgi:hypothetical protein